MSDESVAGARTSTFPLRGVVHAVAVVAYGPQSLPVRLVHVAIHQIRERISTVAPSCCAYPLGAAVAVERIHVLLQVQGKAVSAESKTTKLVGMLGLAVQEEIRETGVPVVTTSTSCAHPVAFETVEKQCGALVAERLVVLPCHDFRLVVSALARSSSGLRTSAILRTADRQSVSAISIRRPHNPRHE